MVDASVVARVLGISVEYVDMRGDRAALLPQRIAVYAQGASDAVYTTTKKRILSAAQAGKLYGYGSPIHLIARELFPENGDGVGTVPVTVYPLADVYDTGQPSAGTITPAGTQTAKKTYRVRAGGVFSNWFTVEKNATVAARCAAITAACNGVLHFPVIATDNTTSVGLTSKWAGESANGIVLEAPDVDNGDDFGELSGGTFTVVQPTGGAANPTLDDALAQVGNVWETMALNAMNADDDVTLDAFQEFGEGRWLETVRRPLVVFVGNTDVDVADATAITAARKDDRVNSQLVAPGSPNLPFVVAARQLARIARQANKNPPVDYGAKRIDRIVAGADVDQWDFVTRDAAVQDGCSTVEVVDGVISIGNIVTMYHPDGESPPAYRDVVDIVKLQNAIYNFDLKFMAEEWAGAPLIPNDQPTTNPDARKPSSALAEVASILDGLGDEAIISDPDTAKKNATANINAQNPDRLDIDVPIQLSGNTTVKSVTIRFGYFFGGAAAA